MTQLMYFIADFRSAKSPSFNGESTTRQTCVYIIFQTQIHTTCIDKAVYIDNLQCLKIIFIAFWHDTVPV